MYRRESRPMIRAFVLTVLPFFLRPTGLNFAVPLRMGTPMPPICR